MKRLLTVLAIVVFICGAASQVHAAPQLSIGSVEIERGETGSVDLSLSGGTEPYAGVNARILLPAGVTVTGVSGDVLLSGGSYSTQLRIPSKTIRGFLRSLTAP